eukprot:scaffold26359_cov122-Cylindrotheca_fusiformis.AAC.2
MYQRTRDVLMNLDGGRDRCRWDSYISSVPGRPFVDAATTLAPVSSVSLESQSSVHKPLNKY